MRTSRSGLLCSRLVIVRGGSVGNDVAGAAGLVSLLGNWVALLLIVDDKL